ncbi:hypothetical protein KIH74_02590 [Kineosporia sp. J2-2]|uniref:Uncharacterized protein n=1 Tax=Kineosporia corallincola TaxID=2835133 RepID=A0ABS5T9P4_9ACTN|nr:hypothetical protein [Kineosporia corallincola]MBT0767795.1 hypothetical protein [Kineosporia corallincola]
MMDVEEPTPRPTGLGWPGMGSTHPRFLSGLGWPVVTADAPVPALPGGAGPGPER